MKKNDRGGYSLIEVLVAMVILGIILIPTCTSLVLSVRINASSDKLLQAQLSVSSAVETLMAEGIDPQKVSTYASDARFANVEIAIDTEKITTEGEETLIVVTKNENGTPYNVTVTSKLDESVSVKTYIRTVSSAEGGDSQ